MADVLGVVASITAIVQLTDRVIGLCKFYIEAAKNAISHLRAILIEISSLKTIFESLKFLTECDGVGAGSIKSISGADGPIEGCRRSLTGLEALLPPTSVEPPRKKRFSKEMMKSATAVLAWPFKEDKARKIMQEIAQYKSTIKFALTVDSAQDIREIKTRISDVHNMLTESQRRDIYQWLQHTNTSDIHFRARKDYESGTGQWVFRCSEWTQLLEAKHRCVWLHGIMGAGKTVLMTYLAEEMRKHCETRGQRNIISVYYYCYFGHEQNEAEPFLKWLILELCRNAEFIPAKLQDLFSLNKESTLNDFLDVLADILSEYETVYITLDAIDESHQRESLLSVLQTMSTDSRFRKLCIIASSREYADIKNIMTQFSVSLSMSNEFVEQDIKLYVGSTLSRHSEFKRWPNSILEEVKEALSKGAQGMFRWAVCQIDILRRLKCDPETIRQKLKGLPKTLNETYDRIFSAIPEEERVFVHHVLQWIIFHNKLRYGEGMPAEIVIDAVEASILEITGHSNGHFYDIDILQDICGCLVKVHRDSTDADNSMDADDSLDEDNSMDADDSPNILLSLAHYTVREYLEFLGQPSTANRPIYYFGRSLDSELIKLVLTLSQRSESYKSLDFGNAVHLSSDPWNFSRCNLGVYCTVSAVYLLGQWAERLIADDQIKNLVIQISHPLSIHFQAMKWMLNKPDSIMEDYLISSDHVVSEIWQVKWSSTSVAEVQHIFNLVLMSSWFPHATSGGLLQGRNLAEFLNTEICFSMRDWGKVPELEFQGTVIEVLCVLDYYWSLKSPLRYVFEHGIELSDPSKMLLFSIGGHKHPEDAENCQVMQLIERGANPDLQTYRIQPLQIAAAGGDYEGVKILLEAGADPDNYGNSGGEAWGDTHIMNELNLLYGHSPFYIAKVLRPKLKYVGTIGEYEDCVALLLEHGATMIHCCTPLTSECVYSAQANTSANQRHGRSLYGSWERSA